MDLIRRRPTAPTRTRTRRWRRVVLGGCGVVLVSGIAIPDQPATTGPDWCWHHYAFAPANALLTDLGPPSVEAADAWSTWLATPVDVPPARRRAHAEQRRLIEQLQASGAWSTDDRRRYRSAAASDPTPSTVCETFGARIIPQPDGSLPDGWADRFTDRDDPAFSPRALDDTGPA